MFFYKSIIFTFFSLTFVAIRTQDDELFLNLDGGLNLMQNLKADLYFKENEILALVPEKVDIKLYYESFCPGCRAFDVDNLSPTVEKLASYLNVHVFPYGNAKTIDNGNGQYKFECQHGAKECYGNKLHACAIDYLGNITKAVFFNSCMMESSRTDDGSDDKAADECGKSMNVDPEWIKQCAKGDRGNKLLKYYGDESKKVSYLYVPWVMVNGVQTEDIGHFFKIVCAAFNTPPPECAQIV